MFHVEPLAAESNLPCAACGSRQWQLALTAKDHHLSQETFSLVDCIQCGLRRTDPRPTAASLARYYEGEDYFSHDASANSFIARTYRTVRRLALASKYRRIRAFVPSGSLVDVGCGTGELLQHLASRGYRVQGIEPGDRARKAAQAKGLVVLSALGQLEATGVHDGIMLWHVLEHLPDPSESLTTIFRALKPGGYIILAVPDRASWDSAHYGPTWAAWDVPRHLWHFRQQDIAALLNKSGFKKVRALPMWLDSFYIALLSERYRGRSGLTLWAIAILNGARSNLMAALHRRPTSSTLFIAQKEQ